MSENILNGKILITGGTGFLGTHLVSKLVADGIAPTVLTRNTGAHIRRNDLKNLNLIELNLLNAASVGEFIESFRPEIIVHLAGTTFQAELYEKLNFEATANLLSAAKTIGVKKIVMLGTADEYGFQKCPQDESMAAIPASDYAASKSKAVNFARSLHESEQLPIVVLRPFTIYGVGQPSRMFISQAVRSAVEGLPFEMSEGMQKRDALFVTDFVDAMIKTLTVEGIEGEIFNVGSGKSIALRDLAKKIWQIAGADENLLRIGARQTNANELHDTEADTTKIRQRLNWKPEVSLDAGLKILVERTIKNRE